MTLTLDIPRSTVVTVAATSFPVTREEVKRWLRETSDDFNPDIESAIRNAVATYEADNSSAIMTQTMRMKLDCFPTHFLDLNIWPVQSISSITYVDNTGTTQTLSASNYTATLQGAPARIAPSFGNAWPGTRHQAEAVVVTFVAGYTSAAVVPETVKQCIRYLVEMDYHRHNDFEELYHALRRRSSWRV